LTGLVKKIDQRLETAGKTPQPLGAYVIFVKDSKGLDKELQGIAECESLKHVSLCIGDPPKAYEIANEADITVVIYSPGRRQNPVMANFALRKGELDDGKTDAIVEALSKVLPK
jgi:hypothetical protein